MTWLLPPPQTEVTLHNFAAMIQVTRLSARFVMPIALHNNAALVGRIRGVWGHALMAAAATGDQIAERSLAFFFANSTSAQKPFSITADEEAGELRVTINLFGAAQVVSDCAFDALITGLTSGNGVALGDSGSGLRRPLRLLDADWTRCEGVEGITNFDQVGMRFQTPFKIGPSGTIGTRYPDLLVAAAIRCSVIARWHGLSLDPALSHVRSLSQSMVYDDSALQPARWDRRSSRQKGNFKAMMGLSGTLTINRFREEFVPLLQITRVTLIGADTSFGLGRFDIF
jgi:hypothetical protein